jgi:hypothetical protein
MEMQIIRIIGFIGQSSRLPDFPFRQDISKVPVQGVDQGFRGRMVEAND